jgi:hypothetical protein
MRTSQGVEVADIFRQYGEDYRRVHRMSLHHHRAMRAIEICRTATLGGHRYKYSCGHVDISYNSCRNRHCPKCQTLQKERWIEARCEDLLPIQYFHVVFTIPAELNPLVIMNQRVMYNILFRSVSETLIELSNNPSISVHVQGLSAFSTHGDKTLWIILIFTALFPAADSLPTEAAGYHAGRGFSSP